DHVARGGRVIGRGRVHCQDGVASFNLRLAVWFDSGRREWMFDAVGPDVGKNAISEPRHAACLGAWRVPGVAAAASQSLRGLAGVRRARGVRPRLHRPGLARRAVGLTLRVIRAAMLQWDRDAPPAWPGKGRTRCRPRWTRSATPGPEKAERRPEAARER